MRDEVKAIFRINRLVYEEFKIRCIREHKTVQAKLSEMIGQELADSGPLLKSKKER